MSEDKSIERVSHPGTRESIANDLRQLGVDRGMVIIIHSSLSSMGWVNGGPVAVIQAFMDVVTTAGTLVMPAHSSELSDPAKWQNPPVPQDWQETIRNTMPLYDPRLTPTRKMGRIAELFRTWPGVKRSVHPQMSFAAWGQDATYVTDNHTLEYSLGERSPLARLYDLAGSILLIGVGYERNTSFHLAEYRVPNPPLMLSGAPWKEGGSRIWKEFEDVEYDDGLFPDIGLAFEQSSTIKIGTIGAAQCRLMSHRSAVDFAQQWLSKHKKLERSE